MKLTKILTLGLLALTFGCSNPNSECIDKIKQQVKENAMGIEMNYRNIEFQWVDTLHVNEKLASLNEQFDSTPIPAKLRCGFGDWCIDGYTSCP